MDVMIDSNVIISAALFPNPRMNAFLQCISEEHQLFLSSYSVDEVFDVIRRKFAGRKPVMERFLQKLTYTFVHTPSVDILDADIYIRDRKDYPILASAIIADVDVLITGDSDFEPLMDMERPEIMTIRTFRETYM
jgi:putative PIN family toxin of toxin-antitoxin system